MLVGSESFPARIPSPHGFLGQVGDKSAELMTYVI